MNRSRFGVATWLVMLAGVAILLGASYWHRFHGEAPAQRPSTALTTRDEILVVFIGGSFCGGSRYPGLKESVQVIHQTLATRFREQGKEPVFVGIALDWSLEAGLDFLKETAPFDEYIVGRNWLNSGAIRYIWRDVPGPASLPQIVVLSRHVDVTPSSISVGSESILARKIGADEIMNWSQTNFAM